MAVMSKMARGRRTINRLTTPAGASEPIYSELPENFLTSKVLNQDVKGSKSRLGSPNYTHASALSNGVCPRAHAIAYSLNLDIVNRVRACDRIVWGIGRFVEKHIRDQFCLDQNYVNILGVWSCKCGATKYQGVNPLDYESCDSCGTKPTEYNEILLQDEEYQIQGNPDFIPVVDGKHVVVEIKSIKAKGARQSFESTNHPVADHVVQASLYYFMMKRLGYRMHDTIVFIYTAKDYVKGQPYKEFHIKVTDESIRQTLDLPLQAALQIKTNRQDKKTLPARLAACQSLTSTKAKSCEVCDYCFSIGDKIE